MIVIDGSETQLAINNFENLEDLLVRVSTDRALEDRIVTDVLVDNENFSEMRPGSICTQPILVDCQQFP